MNGAFYVAGIGLETQQNALDTLANNIANLNTRGFKRMEVQFSELVAETARASQADDMPSVANQALAGVMLQTRMAMSQQGELERTDQPMDLALDGSGFIELLGHDGDTALWRGGRLQINEDGFLAAANGMMLAAQISVPDSAVDMRIDADGRVEAVFEGGEREEIGQIGLLRIKSEQALERLDGGIYRVEDSRMTENAEAGLDGMGRFVQGSLERSNVDLNREMVDMMIVQRAYAANAQVVQAADQMLSIANNLRR